MGGVLFFAKVEPAKAKPAINRFEIESRLQEISTPALAGELPVEASLPFLPLATLANDTSGANDRPLINPSDSLAISLSPHQNILAEFQAAIAVSTSSNSLTR